MAAVHTVSKTFSELRNFKCRLESSLLKQDKNVLLSSPFPSNSSKRKMQLLEAWIIEVLSAFLLLSDASRYEIMSFFNLLENTLFTTTSSEIGGRDMLGTEVYGCSRACLKLLLEGHVLRRKAHFLGIASLPPIAATNVASKASCCADFCTLS